MNLSPLMIFPVLFPIVSGMALMLSRPGTDEQHHRYETFVVLMNALLVFVSISRAGDGTLTLWRATETLALSFRMDELSKTFAVLVSVIWPLVTFYAFGYLKRRPPEDRFFAFFLTNRKHSLWSRVCGSGLAFLRGKTQRDRKSVV